MTHFVVVDAGCIECGEGTSVVGVFDSDADALARLAQYAAEKEGTVVRNGFAYWPGGQHHVGVYEAA